MAPPLVLDTNAFVTRGFSHWLRGHHAPKILPTVAYAELSMHLRRRLPRDAIDRSLSESGVKVEWLTADLASNAVEIGLREGDWQNRAADYLIGAHALGAPRILVTNNLDHFRFLTPRVRTPAQVMASQPGRRDP